MAIDPLIKQIKIHPAIGFARLSTNPDYFVFNPANPVQPTYKSNNRIKRQAVQFRLFAYDDANNGLYEVTPAKLAGMGLKSIWSADLINAKTKTLTQSPSDRFSARGDTAAGDLNLVGNLSTFVEGQAIPMGTLTGKGLFIPPIAGAFKRETTTVIADGTMYQKDVSDNTSDGSINVRFVDSAGQPVGVSVMPAWISVAPPDFAPGFDEALVTERNLLTFLSDLLGVPNTLVTNPVNRQARKIDRNMLETGTSNFGPGIEVAGGILPSQFYPPSVTGDPDEIRFMPAHDTGGVAPGSLTSGLCSPWQYDFRACTCSWWPNHRPDIVFKPGGATEKIWKRKIDAASGNPPAPPGELASNADFVDHVYELGIIKRDPADANKRIETERNNDI